MMEIGLISDTHGFLDPRVFDAFADCDEVWHAGDFGNIEIAHQLEEFKRFRAVYGNIDAGEIRTQYPEDLKFEIEGVSVLMSHIVGRPGRYNPRIKKLIQANTPQLLVCGHSHLLHLEQDKKFGGMQYVNPGAAGYYGQQIERTLLKFKISEGDVSSFRVIELKPRHRKNQHA